MPQKKKAHRGLATREQQIMDVLYQLEKASFDAQKYTYEASLGHHDGNPEREKARFEASKLRQEKLFLKMAKL